VNASENQAAGKALQPLVFRWPQLSVPAGVPTSRNGGAEMTKSTIFALLGLAVMLALASPPRANAGVVIGIGVGPVYPRPAYGYVIVHPRPYVYYAPGYVYAPRYVHPPYNYYRFHGRVYPDRRQNHRDGDRRHDYRGNGWRHGDRR
jgi:hypothetical protein